MKSLRFWPLAILLAISALINAAALPPNETVRHTALTPPYPERFFLPPDELATLVWKIAAPMDRIDYAIRDYQNRPVSSGTVIPAADGTLSIPVKLARGYYEIILAGETFGVVSQDAFTRAPDPFFGMDSVLTWLERRPAARVSLVKILKRSGIALSRERFRWQAVNPAPDTWKWSETDRADDLRSIYKAENLPVLEMFHDPGPARGEFPVPTRYPQDLVQLTRSWPVIHDHWKATWGALEVWNEPDGRGYGSGLPPDQYLPFVKAMRWAFQQHKVTAPLGGGVLIGTDPGDYTTFLSLNGLLDHVDFVSFHDYRRATDMQGLIARYRDWMKASGKPGMPLWLTEVGFSWPKGPGRAPSAADKTSALEITMKGIEARACGIIRFMPFCLPFYEENGVKNFAMLGRELTPMRSFAAYVQSIRALAGRSYLGDLRLPGADLLRARVFGPVAGDATSGCVVVLYTGKSTPVSVPLSLTPTRVEAADGRALPLGPGTDLTLEDGLAYLYAPSSALAAFLDRDTPAAALLAASRLPVPPSAPAGPIVLQNRVNPAQVTYSSSRYIVDAATAAALKLTIRAVNLSDRPQPISLGLRLPGEPGAPLTRIQKTTLPAQGTADLSWTVDTARQLDITRTLPVTISGTTDDGLPVSPLSLPFRIEGTLDGFKQRFPYCRPLPLGSLDRWEKNLATHGTQTLSSEGSNDWRLSFSFDRPVDRWVYPKFKLAPDRFPGATGIVLRLRAKEKASLRLMLFKANGTGYWTSIPIAPADGRWHVAFVPLSEFETLTGPNPDGTKIELDQFDSLAIGMNDASEGLANVLDVSDAFIVGPHP